jgi:hypothetical protein
MKPQITAVLSSFVIVGLLFLFASCGHSQSEIDAAREEGYKAGYDQAIEENKDFENALEAAYFDGLCDGLNDGYDIGSSNIDVDDVLEQADSYAYRETGRDVYEAWNDIMIYIDNSGARNELAKNAETLMYYCMFLDDYSYYYKSDITDSFE